MTKPAKIALIALALIAGGAALQSVQIVTVTLPKEKNRPLAMIRVGPGDIISLSYVHSVELTAVVGRFKIDRSARILAVETRMETVGSGLPNAHPERTRITEGWLVVDEKDQPVEPIRFYWVPMNKTRVSIAGRGVDLEHLKPGALVQISAQNRSRASWLWHSHRL